MNLLLTEMLSHADPSQVAGLARFFKTGPGQYGEGDCFLGIKVPVTRAVVKATWRRLGTPWDGNSGAFPELEECLASPYHELRLAALLALVEIFRHAKGCPVPAGQDGSDGHEGSVTPGLIGGPRQQCIDFYLAHTAAINNWDLVDLSCYPLLGEWLLDKDRSLLYDLARDGRTLWEQRIGIVSTMTFIRHGQMEDTFAIADILLHHPHDLIHKAVGWLLREAGKRDKNSLETYLLGPDPAGGIRCRTMPRTMLRYAVERFPEAERQSYLKGHAR
ncbi:MAG: DNA alkylation repair protein [Bacteroidales bacterium]|nr:DNA alkylation repair protein [Bacteroidales bacterium]